MVKVCTKCKVEKELTDFYKDKKNKIDGCFYICKECSKEYSRKNKERDSNRNKKYYKENKEKIDLRNKKYREDNNYTKKYYSKNKKDILSKNKKYYNNNKEEILLQKKEYAENNKDEIKQTKRKRYLKNKESVIETAKIYYKNNKDKINEAKRKYYLKNKKSIVRRVCEYERNRIKTDPLFKMKRYLRTRTYIAFKNKGYRKTSKTQEMLGIDWEVAKQHIERQFNKGMNWNNYGEWHIDHIIPLSSASTSERLKELCHYTNLQPLWAEDNLSKSDKIIEQQTLLRI